MNNSNTAHSGSVVKLAAGAIGIVYGDIGTSPLYSIKETFLSEHHELIPDRINVLGAISIVTWSLILIIAVKYVMFVLRADNDGEGGILALTALIASKDQRRRISPLVMLGLFGTALLYGDGVITPAISVLSAVEGTELISTGFHRWIVPLSVAILVALFAIQSKGTHKVGRIFGPIMMLWFATMAVLGTISLAKAPEVLEAVNPYHAIEYFQHNGFKAFLSMGALFLVVTGGEALYADMGHFGRKPIMLGWYAVVMPALLLCYYGIGALLLRSPDSVASPFFMLAPKDIRIPLIILATMATVIASQALISGVYSMTLQAMHLGYLPRMKVVNTSPDTAGQIYIPGVNWALMIACVGLVLGFRSSGNLAAAYGLAVTATMFATTILFTIYAQRRWKINRVLLWAAASVALVIESAYLGANLFKIPYGGWFPLVIGAILITVLTTWRTGKRLVYERVGANKIDIATFARALSTRKTPLTRTPGAGVYLYSRPAVVPTSLRTTMQAAHSLPENVYIVSVQTMPVPTVPAARREERIDHPAGITEIHLRYGFMDETPVADDLAAHFLLDPKQTMYFLGKESVRASDLPGMAKWRERLFALMNRNTADVAAWFQLPQNRVVEIGSRIDL